MLWDDFREKLENVVPKHSNITQQIPYFMRTIHYNDQIDLKPHTGADKKQVHKYVTDTLLHKDQVTRTAKDAVTPIHKTMLLMGCYGDRWGPARHTHIKSIDEILRKNYMKHDTDMTPALFVNLILQAFDTYDSRHTVSLQNFTQSTHDKSVCSCLRDFATPSLLQVNKAEEDAADTTCKPDDKTYKYDTCSVQRLLDYAVDGNSVTDGSASSKRTMLVATSGSPAHRNLQDPILKEIIDYETRIKNAFPEYPNNLFFTNTAQAITHLSDFVQDYCSYANLHDGSSSALALACPAAWYNADGTWKIGLKVSEVFDKMKTWPKYMHTYNKLRTPYIHDDDRTLDKTTVTQLINEESFRTYIEKYKVAFETCSAVGVHTYSTRVTGTTQYINWYTSGELFLLLASSFLFLWARVLKETHEDAKTKPKNQILDVLRFMHTALSTLMILALVVIIFWYSSKHQLQTLENDDREQDGGFLTGFVAVYIILGSVAFIISCLVFGSTVGLDLYHLFCMKDYKIVNQLSTVEHNNVVKNVYYAQIALDVPVILGITFLGVATTLQRGVVDYNMILTIIVLLTTTGLITHMTNVLRLMHLQAQAQEQGNDKVRATSSAHLHRIKYNRVIIGVIIAFMLIVFRNLAGLDSVQGSQFSGLHQTYFALIAFVIFVCGDLSLEAFAMFSQFKDPCNYVVECVQQKSTNTAWLIIIGLWVLQLHQRHYLCPAYELVGGDYELFGGQGKRPLLCSWY
jgi:hypothetical protein